MVTIVPTFAYTWSSIRRLRIPSFATSDLITYVLAYNKEVARTLHHDCGLNITEYRILAYLNDHIEAVHPMQLALVQEKSPAMITVSVGVLSKFGLVERETWSEPHTGRSGGLIRITKAGIDRVRDADTVLAREYEDFFSPLPANLKTVLDSGSMATNTNTGEGNRMRDGHFFSAFETLHAFLIVEDYLTKASQSHGMTLNGFRILFALKQTGKPLSPSSLCDMLLLEPSAVSYALGNLAEFEFVVRNRNPLDKRGNLVMLTDAGIAAFERTFEAVEAVFTTDIRPSGRTERDAYKDISSTIVSCLRLQRKR